MKTKELTKEEKDILLEIARKSVKMYLEKGERYKCECKEEGLMQHCGVFVSIHIGERLRGCIGTFSTDSPLYETVSEMAREAAFHDPRFPSLSLKELNEVEFEISVLSPFRTIKNIEEIEIGKHGIYITKSFRRGVLLPQVATKYNWSREEFLSETCIKAGLSPNEWKKKGVTIQIFSAQIFSEGKHNKYDKRKN